MTNFELITSAAIANKLYTKEEAEEIIMTRGELPLHTFAEWKSRGYSVKKGEKAKLKTRIWKFKREKVELPMQGEGENVEQDSNTYYFVTAAFFTPEQVERIRA